MPVSDARKLLRAMADEMDRRDEMIRNCGEHRMARTEGMGSVAAVIRTILDKTEEDAPEDAAEPSEPDDPERYHTWPA
jgi:hypothetical protein